MVKNIIYNLHNIFYSPILLKFNLKIIYFSYEELEYQKIPFEIGLKIKIK